MAGTLTVQNLQGPSTGANANKIIIPSGQTLDVSGGTLTPSAGQVIQTVNVSEVSALQTTSTSMQTVTFANITPSTTSNAILINVNAMVYKNNTNGGSGGAANFLISANNVSIPEAQWTQDTNTANYIYWTDSASSLNFIYHFSRTYLHFPSSTSQQTIRFRVRSVAGGEIYIYPGAQLILQEIAQ